MEYNIWSKNPPQNLNIVINSLWQHTLHLLFKNFIVIMQAQQDFP